MKSIQTEIIINAPADRVWEVLTKFEDYPDWNPFITSIDGEAREGQTLTNHLMVDGKRNVFKPRVVKVVPGQAFEWIGKLPLGAFTGHHQFEMLPIDQQQTKLIHREDFSGWLSGFILGRIGDATRQGFIEMNRALKQRAEQA